jgi:hypothetical protein
MMAMSLQARVTRLKTTISSHHPSRGALKPASESPSFLLVRPHPQGCSSHPGPRLTRLWLQPLPRGSSRCSAENHLQGAGEGRPHGPGPAPRPACGWAASCFVGLTPQDTPSSSRSRNFLEHLVPPAGRLRKEHKKNFQRPLFILFYRLGN